MYSEFDRVFSLSMSSVQRFASQKDPNTAQKDSPSNSALQFTPTSQNPSPEADKDGNKREGNIEAEGEKRSPTTLLPPSSSSSCSSEEVAAVKDDSVEDAVKEEEETDRGKDGSNHGGDDDDGYHTPTSPKHRIPEIRECPPAPKKPANLLYMKRKMRASQARRRIHMEAEVGSCWGAELDDAGPRTKKPKGESTNA